MAQCCLTIRRLQCGRIYKDAEIGMAHAHESSAIAAFNVAASIKMRKFEAAGFEYAPQKRLQCGRIYKDAEMNARA